MIELRQKTLLSYVNSLSNQQNTLVYESHFANSGTKSY